MMMTISAYATLDLSNLGKTNRESCQARLTYGHLGLPEELEISIEGVDVNVINALLKDDLGDTLVEQNVVIAEDNGRRINSCLKFLRGIQPGINRVSLSFLLGQSEISEGAVDVLVAHWGFCLSNIWLITGDERVRRPSPRIQRLDGSVTVKDGQCVSKVQFKVDGREWELIDDFSNLPKNVRKAQEHEAVVSGTLRTPACSGDDLSTVAVIAGNVCDLLSLALARDVKVTMAFSLDADERVINGTTTPVFVYPSGQGNSAPVNNFNKHVLKNFIETTYPIVHDNRNWWSYTIAMFLESRVTPYIEIRSAILNVLLDRITTKVVGEVTGPQIDAEIPKRIKQRDFRVQLHTVLSKLSSNWNDSRTEAVISRVRELNARPSFGKKVAMACERLGVLAPQHEGNDPRHALLHEGELVSAAGSVNYWQDLDALIVQMLLRMLGYDGMFYHFKYGPQPVILEKVRTAAVDNHEGAKQ